MNEPAPTFNSLNSSTTEVLEAAETEWNFLKFKPGIVGGPCIGVSPHFLTIEAVILGYHPLRHLVS